MGFTIRDSERHTIVGSDIIDLKIKEKFNLNRVNYRGEEDEYCQFYFPESARFYQRSISWVALLHTIIYYSEIGYGPASRYDLECALSYVRRNSILFPKYTTRILSDILNALREWGFYVFVEFNDNKKDTNCYTKEDSRYFFIKTEMGICKCNQDGVLVDFFPSLELHSVCERNLSWPTEITDVSDSLYEDLRYSSLSPNTLHWISQGIQKCNSAKAGNNRYEAESVLIEEKLNESENKDTSNKEPLTQDKTDKPIESTRGRDIVRLKALIGNILSKLNHIFKKHNNIKTKNR